MHLYLLQHGVPKTAEEDPERPLSERGVHDVQKVANFIYGVDVEDIFHSGKLRARETAEIMGRKLAVRVEKKDGLTPMDPPILWAERLTSMEMDTMLVGHLPHLGKLAALLLVGDPEADVVEFRQGGIVCLRREKGKWTLQWMVVPELIK
jgi:phosphohistidine phosphatase